MSKKASKNRAIFFSAVMEAVRLWRSRPDRKRTWQVMAAFGGAKFTLHRVREKDLAETLAPNYRIMYVDPVEGFVFVNVGTPSPLQSK